MVLSCFTSQTHGKHRAVASCSLWWFGERGFVEPSANVAHAIAQEVHSFHDFEQGPMLGAPGWFEDQPGCACVYEYVCMNVCVFV